MLKYIKYKEKKDKREKRYLKRKLEHEKIRQSKIKKKHRNKLTNIKKSLTNEITEANEKLTNAENKIANRNNAINILICIISFLVSVMSFILFILFHTETNIIIKILISILPFSITSIILFRKNIIKLLKYIKTKEFIILINKIIEFVITFCKKQ